MTEESMNTPEGAEPHGVTPPPVVEEESNIVESETFTSGEGLVALGGGIVLACYLLFDVILAEYGVRYLAVLFAILAVVLPRMSSGFAARIAPLPVLMKSLGYLLAIVGVITIVENIRFASGALDSFTEILGALIAYAGFTAAFLGARSIDA